MTAPDEGSAHDHGLLSRRRRVLDVDAVVGQRIVGVSRVLYEAGGVLDPNDGRLELTTDTGAIAFDGGSDGEQLVVESEPWQDPFAGQLSPENRDWVAAAGKWTRVELSDDPAWRPCIGRTIVAVDVLLNGDKPTGARLHLTGTPVIVVDVVADELHARVATGEPVC